MKEIIIARGAKVVERIESGACTMLVTKTRPKLEMPFKVYIYCTKKEHARLCKADQNGYDNTQLYPGRVIGEFVCDRIVVYTYNSLLKAYTATMPITNLTQTCLNYIQMNSYGKGKPLYGWHISYLKIYDIPREVEEFTSPIDCKKAQYQDDPYFSGWFCMDEECDCPYFDCPSVGGECDDWEDYAYCLGKGKKPIKRVKNWCYVERIK